LPMTNISGEGGSFSSGNTYGEEAHHHLKQQKKLFNYINGTNLVVSSSTSKSNRSSTSHQQQPQPAKKKRSLPGTPDPNAEVIALSPKTLMSTNRFVCEICNKGFQRDQNLQLHRRGHNLPWKLRQRSSGTEIRKRVYVCPETSCVHHHPGRALGDFTGIKKHFFRKHGEKKWKCDRCSKKYAVQCDWKAHSKVCGTKEYKCDCGIIFSRRDGFIAHRTYCDALAENNNKPNDAESMFSSNSETLFGRPTTISPSSSTLHLGANSPPSSALMPPATVFLQRAAAQMAATVSDDTKILNSLTMKKSFVTVMAPSSLNGTPYEDIQTQTDRQPHDQLQLGGVDGGSFASEFIKKMGSGREASPPQFFESRMSPGTNCTVGIYPPGLFDESLGLFFS
ncbi:hypothetical protein U1Q18_004237, partial [Sarracenia purpurea var. burkii]